MKRSFLKNGILHQCGKPVFAVGQTYYGSFHPKKMPVPPDGDQLGEMCRDLENIKHAGFNLVRTAALGELHYENGEIHSQTPLIDRMLERAEELNLSMMVRLQGYSVNFRQWQNTRMVRSDGTAISPHDWSNFILDSLFHDGIIADNFMATRYLAEHFRAFPSVNAFVIYNEPHYPGDGIYDYHPDTVAAWRKWLAETGRMTPELAAAAEAPRRRPLPGEPVEPWIDWRLFAIDSLSDFLVQSAAAARESAPECAMLTCQTPNQLEFDNAVKGVDYFRVAEGMDLLGLTLYKNAAGGDYETTALILACAESAAALCGKHFWMVEIDAATNIPLRRFLQQNLLALGMGTKGMMFYQWRGDYPFPGKDTPEPNGFGFVNSDNTPAPDYREKLQFVALLNRLSPYLTAGERQHAACGILFSHYAAMRCDARENATPRSAIRHRLGQAGSCNIWQNSCMAALRRLYGDLRRQGVQPTVVEARHLRENKFHLRSLYVPSWDDLSEPEREMVQAFQANGGEVFVLADDIWQPGLCKSGFERLGANKEKYDVSLHVSETLMLANIEPAGCVSSEMLAAEWIAGEDFELAAIINIGSLAPNVSGAVLKPRRQYTAARWFDADGSETELRAGEQGVFRLPEIGAGGVLLLQNSRPAKEVPSEKK